MVEGAIDRVFEGEVEEVFSGLGKGDDELFGVVVIVLGSDDMRMAGGSEPLMEEGGQILAADGGHDFGEVVAGGVLIPISGVIFGDAFPEQVVADAAAEHVKDPAAFFVAVGVEELHEVVVDTGVYDRGHPSFFISDQFSAIGSHSFFECIDAVFVLEIAVGHVGGKAFAEPEVVPLGLGGGVAEPLVGDLVGHQGFDAG